MQIRGWVKTSLIDFPGRIATVLFTSGCNFRCPYCQNSGLVLHPESLPEINPADIFQLLRRRRGLIDGVVITGGEPTLHEGLEDFLRKLKELGLATKLDTNGYRPDVLEALLREGLVDYVAMDVKAPPAKYPLLVGRDRLDLRRLDRSIGLVRESGVLYEFRTTVVPGLLDVEDVEGIARWIQGARRYVLQQFRPVNTLDPALEAVSPYRMERLEEMARRARPWVEAVEVRG